MKRIFALCLSVLLLIGMRPTAHAADEITVTINGEAIVFDQPPVLADGRTLVSVRAVCEALGADVYWYDDYETVFIVKNDIKLMLTASESSMVALSVESFDELLPMIEENLYDEDTIQEIFLDVPAQNINGRILLPIRAVCEALGATVDWSGETQTVLITCAQEIIDDKNRDTDFFDRFAAFGAEQEKEYYKFFRKPFLGNDYIITMKVRGSFASNAPQSQYASLLKYKLKSYGIASTKYDSMRIPNRIMFFFGVDGTFDQAALTEVLKSKPTVYFKDADGNVLLDMTDIAHAELEYAQINDAYEPCVTLSFTETGRVKFAQATERVAALASTGKNYISIYVDDVCISSPLVTEKIDSEACLISDNLDDDTASILAAVLNFQNYPTDLRFEFEIEANLEK